MNIFSITFPALRIALVDGVAIGFHFADSNTYLLRCYMIDYVYNHYDQEVSFLKMLVDRLKLKLSIPLLACGMKVNNI